MNGINYILLNLTVLQAIQKHGLDRGHVGATSWLSSKKVDLEPDNFLHINILIKILLSLNE